MMDHANAKGKIKCAVSERKCIEIPSYWVLGSSFAQLSKWGGKQITFHQPCSELLEERGQSFLTTAHFEAQLAL